MTFCIHAHTHTHTHLFLAPGDFTAVSRQSITFSPNGAMQTSTVIVDIKVDGVVENTENFSGLLELDPGTERITVNPAMASVMITDNDSKQSAYELICFCILMCHTAMYSL